MFFPGSITFLDFNGLLALASGFLSFFSPCILPLVPSYLIFISGMTFDDYNELSLKRYKKNVFMHSIAFILGFSFIFVSLGLSSSLIGRVLFAYQKYIIRVGGIFLILMGLYYLNIFRIPFLDREKMIHLKEKPAGLFGSFIVGITFSLGWTPCVGPALSSILIIASTTQNVAEGVYLLSLYAIGMALPFLASALVFDRIFGLLKRYGHVVRYSMKVVGVLLIIIGLLLVTNYYSMLNLRIGMLFS